MTRSEGESFADSASPGHPSLLVPLPSGLSPVLSDAQPVTYPVWEDVLGDLALS